MLREGDELFSTEELSAHTRILICKPKGVMDVERRELGESAQPSSTPNAFVSAVILECPSLRVVTALMS